MTDTPDPDGVSTAPTPRKTRASVMLTASIERFGGGEPSRHRVRDLSTDGLRIDQAIGLQVGATVLISIGALQAIGATVVWVDKGSAGLRFIEPINPDDARAKAVITPRPQADAPRDVRTSGPTAGWMPDLPNPYRKL
ncbi:PilZ domain-containing protein [Sphingomonas sp. BAUL-RG-20F-R05-02]|uniref:PilZ domain-containing protein n=1 Tax=Sphingomonas sp. BAUL-RG-20F-R05-02 TaxID=2914830 RepID=UPI001F5607B4|nr:PilZ domain-containing protein [Sphingomonas sp. BAUL-RG-20F-R05-02]